MLRKVFVLAVLVLVACVCFGDVRLPNFISNNMVLQQNEEVRIWGWAEAGEKIEVRGLWQKSAVKAVADKDGKWLVKIKTPKAGGPFAVAIKGNNEIILQNVMIGEVWLCSGQSNMQMRFKPNKWVKGILNYEEEIANGNYPGIRMFTVANVVGDEPKDNCGGEWKVCNPDTVGEFSATAYFFGRYIHKQLGVPVGLINSSWGGSPAEAWTKDEFLRKDPDLEIIIKNYETAEKAYPEKLKKFNEVTLPDWEKAKEQAEKEGKDIPKKPKKPSGPRVYHKPSSLYNSMIHPFLNYKIKGAIWYQGETNAWRAYQYRKLFPTMIENWREDFGIGDFPFYFVQLAPFNYNGKDIAAELREAQLMTLKSVKNTGMVVTNDLAPNIHDIHPRNKQDVGKRLGLWAMAKTYGKDFMAYSGPIYKDMKIEGNKIRVSFDYTYDALAAEGGQVRQFEIAGADKKYVDAKAFIDGKTVVVSSDSVNEPVAVRYCWGNKKIGNLYNSGKLPASPFRTDEWPGVTVNNK